MNRTSALANVAETNATAAHHRRRESILDLNWPERNRIDMAFSVAARLGLRGATAAASESVRPAEREGFGVNAAGLHAKPAECAADTLER
jgi:hypothetical protein